LEQKGHTAESGGTSLSQYRQVNL